MVNVVGDGVPLLYLTIILLVLSWLTFVTRVGVRRWIHGFGTDDWLMGGGLVLYTVTAALVIVCCFYGAGQYSAALTVGDIQTGTKLFFIAEFFYAACTVLIKCSISVTLLRIADARRRFVWTLWAVMGLTAVAAVVFILAIANICHPITMLWGETTEGICNPSLNSTVSFVFSAVSIVTDLVLAILPGILLWNIRLKKTVKASVVVILGMAAFASCATIIRLRYLTLYNDQTEFMFSTGAIGLWSILEEGIGIIAGSLPALRPLLSLPALGGNGRHTGDSATNDTNQLPKGPHAQHQQDGSPLPYLHTRQGSNAIRLNVFDFSPDSESGSQRGDGWGSRRGSTKTGFDNEDDNDGDSQRQIMKEVQVTVEAEESDQAGSDDWIRQQVLGWDTSRRCSQAHVS
ncbi:hypothetical protein PG993_011215 [Apiospora rasikravindrae]|uniref:Rhodopsin domain-containing protein n=1 Tax=Apiospora rasikravindrae TaxID=990691 RepID=A0ABR1SFC2_9PEZI